MVGALILFSILSKIFIFIFPDYPTDPSIHPITLSINKAITNLLRLTTTSNLLRVELREEHRVVLTYLLEFLQQVIEHSEDNRMNSASLAIVFGPNLLWSGSGVATLTSMSKINSFTKYIIDNFHIIFKESDA